MLIFTNDQNYVGEGVYKMWVGYVVSNENGVFVCNIRNAGLVVILSCNATAIGTTTTLTSFSKLTSTVPGTPLYSYLISTVTGTTLIPNSTVYLHIVGK